MTPLFKKLKLKNQPAIIVLGATAEFDRELDGLQGVKVHRNAEDLEQAEFALVFVTSHTQLQASADEVLPKMQGDAVVWIAYPKSTSKWYTGEINHDSLSTPLITAGFQIVRQVTVNKDWLALQFRRVEFIKTKRRGVGGTKTKASKTSMVKMDVPALVIAPERTLPILRLARFLVESMENVPDDAHPAVIERISEDLQRFTRPILPEKGQSVAVTLERMKTASLAFDRVWSPQAMRDHPPPDVAVYGATEAEMWMEAVILGRSRFPDWNEVLSSLQDKPLGRLLQADYPQRGISELLFEMHSIESTPIYSSIEHREVEYKVGQHDAVVSLLENIAIPNERLLTWEQVLEFRNDKQMRSHYRKLIHWLNSSMVGRSLDFIEDDVAIRLEGYERALQKHGIMTVLGTIESLLDPRFFAGVATLLAGFSVAGATDAGAVATTLAVVGKATCSLIRSKMNIDDARRGNNAEVAYVYQMKREAAKG